jgi:hypothetical protein
LNHDLIGSNVDRRSKIGHRTGTAHATGGVDRTGGNKVVLINPISADSELADQNAVADIREARREATSPVAML